MTKASAGPRVVSARAARARMELALEALGALGPGAPCLFIGPSRPAMTELAVELTRRRGATLGIHRKTLRGLATETVAVELAELGVTVARGVVFEAVVREAVRGALVDGALGRFAEVAKAPGFALALARTLEDLEMNRVDRAALAGVGPSGPDLARLAARVAVRAREQHLVSQAEVAERAAAAFPASALAGLPCVFLDVSLARRAEIELARAVIAASRNSLVLIPSSDHATGRALEGCGYSIEDADAGEGAPLDAFRARLFARETAPPLPREGLGVRLFSAPAESLEAVEVARAILAEARAGARFDEVMIVVKSRETYASHVVAALDRARIPFELETGTRRPHPAGRAMLALLACRAERGSGRRLFEYLSTGQMPGRAIPGEEAPMPDADLGRFGEGLDEPAPEPGEKDAAQLPRPPLRAWMRVLGEIGLREAGAGGSLCAYLDRRLDAARLEIDERLARVHAEEGDEEMRASLERDREQLAAISLGLSPVLRALDALPIHGPWSEMLPAMRALAEASLTRPGLVLSALDELAPLALGLFPVALDEVIAALTPRLAWLEGPGSRERDRGRGKVVVTTPEGARGRSRRTVFVLGLAEGIFPARVAEDPLLLDDARERLDARLPVTDDRTERERSQLCIAAGAAEEKLFFSYPRLDANTGRPRVPSVYALEVARALLGAAPSLDAIEREATPASRIALAWPAPRSTADAIDDLEQALSLVRERGAAGPSMRGRARFLLDEHPFLGRALRTRWQRYDTPTFTSADGLVARSAAVRHQLEAFRLRERAYAPSALEAYAACPYRFYLRGVLRLSERAEAEALDRFDPRLYGELYHRCQAALSEVIRARPLDPHDPNHAHAVLDAIAEIVARVGESAKTRLDPIVARVFDDEMDRIASDLVAWADEQLAVQDDFRAYRAELPFGLSPRDEVRIAGGYRLKGVIDAVETDAFGRLRVTDYKTGRAPDGRAVAVVRGGEMLQPILYAMALEGLRGRAVPEHAIVTTARLYFATRRGGFETVEVPIAPDTVGRAMRVLDAIDGAIEKGVLLAAPRREACERCAYRVICGPNEEQRTHRRQGANAAEREVLAALADVRGMP